MTSILSFVLCLQAVSDPFPQVAKAIMWKESKGDPEAVGDHGQAIGPYQIHRDYWTEGTRFLGVNWPYQQARDPEKAIRVVHAYTKHYAKAYKRPWNTETIARIHNGGPMGWKKRATLGYYRDIQVIMEAQEKS